MVANSTRERPIRNHGILSARPIFINRSTVCTMEFIELLILALFGGVGNRDPGVTKVSPCYPIVITNDPNTPLQKHPKIQFDKLLILVKGSPGSASTDLLRKY